MLMKAFAKGTAELWEVLRDSNEASGEAGAAKPQPPPTPLHPPTPFTAHKLA